MARIVVAEDEEHIARLLAFKLTQAGHTVAVTRDGGEAWTALSVDGADLAILDVMMPVEDGLTLLRRIRTDARLAALPVLLLTARGREHDVVVGLAAGATEYIVKPFSPAELVARVERWTGPKAVPPRLP